MADKRIQSPIEYPITLLGTSPKHIFVTKDVNDNVFLPVFTDGDRMLAYSKKYKLIPLMLHNKLDVASVIQSMILLSGINYILLNPRPMKSKTLCYTIQEFMDYLESSNDPSTPDAS